MEINVGAVISAFRKQKGVTQEALADFVGVCLQSLGIKVGDWPKLP